MLRILNNRFYVVYDSEGEAEAWLPFWDGRIVCFNGYCNAIELG